MYTDTQVHGIRLFFNDGLTCPQIAELLGLHTYQIEKALYHMDSYREVPIYSGRGGQYLRAERRKEEIDEIWKSIWRCKLKRADAVRESA